MNIRYGYNSKKVVTFDTQDRLDDKIDKLTSMMSKLTAKSNNQNKQYKPKIYHGKREDKQEIITIKAIITVDTDQIVVIGEFHLGVELSMDRIIEEGCNMLKIIEMTLGEEILVKCKIMEVSIIEVDIEAIIEMTGLEEVEVVTGKDSIQVILEEIIKTAVVDQDQV